MAVEVIDIAGGRPIRPREDAISLARLLPVLRSVEPDIVNLAMLRDDRLDVAGAHFGGTLHQPVESLNNNAVPQFACRDGGREAAEQCVPRQSLGTRVNNDVTG